MAGSQNFARVPAMSRAQAEQALAIGVELATSAAQDGIGVVGTGDMGIGNTTPSAAITAIMTGCGVAEATGRGTGINDETYRRKVALLEGALALHQPNPREPLDVLQKVGGLEIAGLTGFILGAAAHRMPVVLDGFIAGAVALLALAFQPRCRDYLIASHMSVECGHRQTLQRLALKPLFDLELRLGEGTGACLGISLIQAGIKILTQMATFTEAGVSGRAL
jgi:nicotinate-nucleotide--dimethylbenzimidazole phosphoribosyltransferase